MIEKEKLIKIVGADNVSYEQATLDEYSRDMSFVNTVRPACVLKPTNAGDAQTLNEAIRETGSSLKVYDIVELVEKAI